MRPGFQRAADGAKDVDKPPQVEKSEASQDRLSLAEVTRAVIANNPSIKAVRAKWEMMKARVPQAAAWEDLFVGADLERFGTTRFGTYSDIEFMALWNAISFPASSPQGPRIVCQR